MALIAARVPRYISTVSSPRFEGVLDEAFAELYDGWSDLSRVAGVDSITSASSGKRISIFASHSRTSLVRGSVVKKG